MARLSEDWGRLHDLVLVGNYVYAATHGQGLQIADVTNPAAPVLIRRVDGGEITDLECVGDRLYTLRRMGDAGQGLLQIFDRTNPTAPALLGQVILPQGWGRMAVSGAYAFIAATNTQLAVVDVQNPAAPVCVASLGEWGIEATGIAIDGNRLYVAAITLLTYDITNPLQPVLLGSFQAGKPWIMDVALQGGLVYTVDDWEGLKIWNMTDPLQPQMLGEYNAATGIPPDPPLFLELTLLSANRAVISGKTFWTLLDVSNPALPVVQAELSTKIVCLATSGDYLYCSRPNAGLTIYDVHDPLAITIAGTAAHMQPLQRVAVSPSRVYVLDGQWLWCVAMNAPPAFAPQGRIPLELDGQTGSALCAQGNTVYVGANGWLQCFDATDPQAPVLLGTIPGDFYQLVALGTTLYGSTAEGVRVVDVTDPAAPALGPLLTTTVCPSVLVSGTRLYALGGSPASAVRVYDIAVPLAPVLLGSYEDASISVGDVHGTRAYLPYKVGDVWTGIRVVDFADPAAPVVLGQFATGARSELHLSPDGTRLWAFAGDTLKLLAVQDALPFPELGYRRCNVDGYPIGITSFTPDYGFVLSNGYLLQLEYVAPLSAPEIHAAIPAVPALDAYPNPFNATTRVRFSVPVAGR